MPLVGFKHSEESRRKISIALKGRKKPPRTEEHNKHAREAHKGLRPSLETIQKAAEKNRGRRLSPEHIKAAVEGRKRNGYRHSEETKRKISEARRGYKVPDDIKKKISKSLIGNKYAAGRVHTEKEKQHLSEMLRGNKCHLWKGGISFEPYCPKFNNGLRRRIRAFFDYKCLLCDKTTEENKRALSCHHVEYNKAACCDGKPVHFAALCTSCHVKTNENRERWEAMIHRIIDEVYNGRSYYTKEEYATRDAIT